MSKPVVLFLTDRGALHQELAARACPPELELRILRNPNEPEVLRVIGDAQFLISERNQAVTASMLSAAHRLSLVVRLGSLHHDLDVAAAQKRGIRVCVQPVRTSIAAAEHVLMMILAVLKQLGRATSFGRDPATTTAKTPKLTREDTFAYNFAELTQINALYQRSVGILGMGEIGVELARRLRAFRPKTILYQKRHPYPVEVEKELGINFADPAGADVLVSLLPYTEQTKRSVGEATFARMRAGSYFVHAGSGGVVDEPALLSALKQNHLRGAALDTFTEEPLAPGHPLIVHARDPRSNLLLTPHVASGTEEIDRAEDFLELLRFLRGEPLLHEFRHSGNS